MATLTINFLLLKIDTRIFEGYIYDSGPVSDQYNFVKTKLLCDHFFYINNNTFTKHMVLVDLIFNLF